MILSIDFKKCFVLKIKSFFLLCVRKSKKSRLSNPDVFTMAGK